METENITAESRCWQKQETHKGIEPVAGSLAGGWGFHCWKVPTGLPEPCAYRMVRYSAAEAATMVANGSITNHPVFSVTGTQLNNRDATQDGIYRALAEHVPAISSPVGGNSVGNDVTENIDMNDDSNDGILRPNGWGRSFANKYKLDWQHSDMKDMAFFYVYPLYDQVTTKGALR